MSEITTNNKNVRDDEIDLLDLFRRMGKGLSRFGNALGKAFLISTVFLLRRWIPLTISIILAIGASYLLKYATESYFTSDLVLRTNNAASTDEMITYINRLHTSCVDGNKEALVSAIGLTSVQTDNILDIQAFWVIDNGNDKIPDFVDYVGDHDVYDTVNVRMQDRLNVRVKILQPQELTNVRDGIIKFINKDPLFQQRNNLRLRQNGELLKRLDGDILLLDSLQKFKYFEETKNYLPRMGSQMIFLQEQKTQLVYDDIYKLYKQKQELEMDRDLYKEIVTVLNDFSIRSQRENSGLYYAKTFIPGFFLLTLLILIIRSNRRKLKEIYNQY